MEWDRLSTPCYGFEGKALEYALEYARDFQLHVMDSNAQPVGRSGGSIDFQLHVMDSIIYVGDFDGANTPVLSTPCYGFFKHFNRGFDLFKLH